jgi:aldose 1-epimerase
MREMISRFHAARRVLAKRHSIAIAIASRRAIGVIGASAMAMLLVTGCAGGSGDGADTANTTGAANAAGSPAVTSARFGTLASGDSVTMFTITNGKGMEVRVIEFGAIIQSIRVPDRDGRIGDVALGYDDLPSYVADKRFIGIVPGRYANRIANAQFTIDGKTYHLTRNNGRNHLHGGDRGFGKVLWRGAPVQRGDSVGVELHYTSVGGEEGYPGTLEARVTYLVTPDNRLSISYHATTDAPTHVNLTQHAIFNLAGAGKGTVADHVATIHASSYIPVDSTGIPLGPLAQVAGTPFDFRKPTPIGARIDADDPQIRASHGYDHCFVLDRAGQSMFHAASVVEPTTGRTLDVYTTEPGMQFYTGNSFRGQIGKGGTPYPSHAGFSLEAEHFPDSPNRPEFPSTLLRPGESYESRTIFAFGATG